MSDAANSKKLMVKIAERYSVEPKQLWEALKKTAFRNVEVNTEQMLSLMIVADQYNLNPFTKEIYAFPDKGGGIVPVVGIDGWSRIINEHPQFDGMNFVQDEESCTCTIFRKDRSHPISVTEWMDECKQENKAPWRSHPRRLLRHKSMIQCSRIAFGFAGIHDPDEADRIVEAKLQPEPQPEPRQSTVKQEILEIVQDAMFTDEDRRKARYLVQTAKSEQALKLYRDGLKEKIVHDAEAEVVHESSEIDEAVWEQLEAALDGEV